jgi:hypothetical protein
LSLLALACRRLKCQIEQINGKNGEEQQKHKEKQAEQRNKSTTTQAAVLVVVVVVVAAPAAGSLPAINNHKTHEALLFSRRVRYQMLKVDISVHTNVPLELRESANDI